MEKEQAPDGSAAFLAGGGEMGARMRALDWASTPLGPVEAWPQSLRSAVSFLLPSRAQIVLFWGPDFITLYNDAYRPVFGAKHPDVLGLPCREAWGELWDAGLKDLLEGVVATVEAYWASDRPFFVQRFGYTEETFFDVSYDPVRDESGRVAGVFCIVSETTARVLADRRLKTLRELGLPTADAVVSAEDACRVAARILATNDHDVPFALLYLLDADGRRATLAGSAGVEEGAQIAPANVELDDPNAPWPFRDVAATGKALELEDLSRRFGPLFGAAWPEPVERALVMPIAQPAQARLAGFVVAGASPRLPFDDAYEAFFDLLVGHVSTAIANARAHEQEKHRAEALAEIDQAKTAFFSNVSHEFRTPLTLILGPLEDALHGAHGELPPGAVAALTVALRNGLRLLKLVNTLLDFSRIEAGRAQASFEEIDLASFCTDLASVFASAMERAGLRYEVRCQPLSAPVFVDREAWEKIVLNLLSNALKFTLAGSVTIALREEPGHALLTVSDTGTGIPQHELPNVFKRFHRIEGAHGRSYEGTGIGLSLVQELVKLHGGAITVESSEGVGTIFSVRIPFGRAHLPRASIGRPASAPPRIRAAAFVEEALRWLPGETPVLDVTREPPPPPAATTGSILLADDNADMREHVRKILVSSGFEVATVANGKQALDAVRATHPDLVLTDVMMPELDGFGLIRALRSDESIAGTPVIVLSARAGEEARVEGLDHGADDYLTKPFSARELLARVQASINLQRKRRAAEEALREIAQRLQHILAERQKAQEEREQLLASERAARAEAERTARIKDDFLAILSHELRTPLNAVVGWSQLLKRDLSDPDRVRQGVEIIERNARLQAQLIADLLDMSRITSGKMRLDVQAVDLSLVIQQVIESIQPAADAKEIRIDNRSGPFASAVQGDPARLQQVVWNLLSNAVKFTSPGGGVRVELLELDTHLELRVSDTGEGIEPEFLAHVFERFRQGDASASRRQGGLGIGLALVKHLVELHGGEVRAASDGPGKGSTFTVELPVKSSRGRVAAPHPPAEGLEAGATLGGCRVLVVDDEPDTLEMLRRVLEDSEAQVTTADCSGDALVLLAAEEYAVIVSDIGMPERDGYELMREIRARGITTPAVALTAFARPEDRTKALETGYQAHVPKPVNSSELLATIASLRGKRPVGAEAGP